MRTGPCSEVVLHGLTKESNLPTCSGVDPGFQVVGGGRPDLVGGINL